MYSSKKKMTIGREREAKPTLRVPVDVSKSAVNKVGKTSKALTYSSSTDFVRGVDTDNNAVGFV